MQRITIALLLVLLTLSQVQSKNYWNELIPKGKEVNYSYEATIDAGTSERDSYSSMFHLRGMLHVQAGKENDIFLRLSDMNYTLDNGRKAEFKEKNPMGIPGHLMTLTKPFRIVYNNDGIFQELGVEENLPDYVLNIKKALASIFQVDWMSVRFDSTKIHSFIKREPGLHGNEENMYNVIPSLKTLRVEKMHHMKSSKHLYHHAITNVNALECDDAFEDPLSHDSQKVYIVDKTQNVLQRIENTGGIYYHPYQAVSPAYRIYTSQSLEMVNMHDIEAAMLIGKETKVKNLIFNHNEINSPLEFVPDKQPLVPEMKVLLQELANFVDTYKIEKSMPNFYLRLLPSRLRNMMKHFDIAMFENLLTLFLQKDTKEINLFYQILPYVGTKASIKFLIALIKERKMSDILAIKALQVMPFFTLPNEQIITESEVLLQMDRVSQQVQNVAILSFSSLLQRAQKREFNHHTFITNDSIKKYIQMFVNKLKASNTAEEKYLYFDALMNTKSPLMIKYLKEAVNGEWWNDNNLRLKAMFALYPLISKNIAMLYELYWPIFTDKTLPTDIRTIVFYFIMKSQPSLSCMINIYWFMQSETNVDVYQTYYTYFQSLANTKDPCSRQLRLQAKQIMKYMRVPYRHSLSQYRRVDYLDPEVNTVESYDLAFIDTDDSLVFKLGFEKSSMNIHMVPFIFYMRISGLRGKLLSNLKMNFKEQMKLFNYEQVIQNLLSLPKMENIQIELLVLKYGQIIFTDLIQKTNYDSKKQLYANLFKTKIQDMINIDFDLTYKLTIPSDIGFPFFPMVERSSIAQHPINFNVDYNNNIFTLNIDGKIKEIEYYLNGLYIQNPFTLSWQNVKKVAAFEKTYPVYLDLNINPPQDMLKISWKKHKNPADNIWVKKNYVAHIVNNYDYMNSGILQKFNPNTKNMIVPHQDNLNNYTLREIEDCNSGYTGRLEMFDTEDSKSLEEISKLQRYFKDTPSLVENSLLNLQFNEDFLLSPLLRYSNLETNMAMMYKNRIRGIFIKYEPSRTNPIWSVDLSVRLSNEITKETLFEIVPAMKINLKGSCAWKNEETLVKRWDTNINWELNSGHTQNSVKGQITRTIPGQTDYKICAEGMETYSEKGVTGNLKILMSSSPEGTCRTDETSIDITMSGERLPEQLKSKYNFPSCHQQVALGMRDMSSYSCLTDKTSIWKYMVEIVSKNMPQQFQRKIESFLEFLRAKYYNHYSQDISNESIKDTTKILLTYPVSNDILDMEMIRQGHHYKLLALPAVNFRRYGLFIPDNLYYSNTGNVMHTMGLVYTCLTDTFNITNTNNTILPNVVTEDWVLAVGNDAENPSTGIWIKRIDNKLALKIIREMNILLVLPAGNGFTLTFDGKTIPNRPLLSNSWLMLMAEKNDLFILMKSCGTQIIYKLNELFIEVPKINMDLAGKCL